MNEGINLLEPNKNTGTAIALRRIQKMRFLTIAVLFIISVSSVILFILVALSPLPALQRQEQALQQTLSASKSSIIELALVNSQTDSISRLIAQRTSFDQPLNLIQSKLTNDITVQQLEMDGNSLLVTVESPSLQSLDTFIRGIDGYVSAKQTFSKVTLVDLTTDQSTNSYAATLQLNYL